MDESDRETGVLRIDCDVCVMARTRACADCIVTYLCGEETGGVVLAMDEFRALRVLSDGGLAPQLRHRARAAPP